jgi:hypothetical protein
MILSPFCPSGLLFSGFSSDFCWSFNRPNHVQYVSRTVSASTPPTSVESVLSCTWGVLVCKAGYVRSGAATADETPVRRAACQAMLPAIPARMICGVAVGNLSIRPTPTIRGFTVAKIDLMCTHSARVLRQTKENVRNSDGDQRAPALSFLAGWSLARTSWTPQCAPTNGTTMRPSKCFAFHYA